jgi:hypothetical protein
MLVSGHNDHFEICEIPGLNHHFQTCSTGAPTEYGQIEETLSPDVLEKIPDWINRFLQVGTTSGPDRTSRGGCAT